MKKLALIALSAGAVALFVGCGGSQPPIGTPGAGSWMSSTGSASHVPGGHEHFIKALFYAFGDGKLAIFK